MAAAAPTGCYKCGRPGHWSRDCSSEPAGAGAASTDNPNPNPNPKPSASRLAPYPRPRFGKSAAAAAAAEGEDGSGGQAQGKKKKKERATRPKLTPDLLLSDDGLGFVLRYFPKAFKPRARPGHEVLSSPLRHPFVIDFRILLRPDEQRFWCGHAILTFIRYILKGKWCFYSNLDHSCTKRLHVCPGRI